MARTEKSAGNNYDQKHFYIEVRDFSLAEKSKDDRSADGWELQVTTDTEGKEYTNWIKRYDNLSGRIDQIKFVKSTIKKNPTDTDGIDASYWQLVLEDADEKYFINFKKNSVVGERFTKVAENLDPDLPLTVSVWKDTSGKKAKAAIKFEQDGKNVPQKYKIVGDALVDSSDETRTGLPTIKVRRDGSKNWDDVNEFYFAQMEDVVIPRFTPEAKPEENRGEVTTQVNDEDSEIPFN